MSNISFCYVFFLLLSLITKASCSSDSLFAIVEPFPENIYPIEFTSAQVTCVAFDTAGIKVPEKILFMRRDEFNIYIELKPNDNLYFTKRTVMEGDKTKLFVNMHIRNVTLNYDSLYGSLGSYECHAFAVGDVSTTARHGFSVSVITRSEIPRIVVPDIRVLHHGDDVTLFCNLTRSGNKVFTPLKRLSWFKNGVLLETVRNPDPQHPMDTLGPLEIKNVRVKDGGAYTCLLEVLLRNVIQYNVSDSTVIQVAPWFDHEGDKEIKKKGGESVTLKCSAKGFPLNVEWKFKSDEMVVSCINSSTDKRYKVTRKGVYDPYYLAVTDLVVTDTGSYYCCLPSNCSANVDKDRCQRFVLTVNVPPWFKHRGDKEIVKKTGESVTMECSPKGFPLNVEWKFKSDEMVVPCINSSTDKRYEVTRKGVYDPYYLAVTDLVTNDTGSYYCCLPSNCSVNVDKDRCQRFVLTVSDTKDPNDGTIALTSHGVFVMLAFFVVSSLFL